MPNEQTFSHETTALVIHSLEQSARPLSKTDFEKMILKSAQIPKKDLPELLKQLAKAGQIRAHGTKRKSYWLPEMETLASERILEELRKEPLTKTDLENKLRSWLHDWPKNKREELASQLVKERRVYKLPPLAGKSRTFLLSADPADPRPYLQEPINKLLSEIQRLKTKLAAAGVTEAALLTAAQELGQSSLLALTPALHPTTDSSEGQIYLDPGQVILERMFQLNSAAATGAPVSLSELRRAMHSEFSDKNSFDQTILSLAGQNRIALQRHDHADSLSQTERELLVADNQGNYFISVTLRV